MGNSDRVHIPFASMVCLVGRETEQQAHARQAQRSDSRQVSVQFFGGLMALDVSDPSALLGSAPGGDLALFSLTV
jgi:hypothetical protein